jgi:hypothetical protein
MENENPVILFDPKTKKKYNSYDLVGDTLSDTIKDRLHTLVTTNDGKHVIVEIPMVYEVTGDLYKRLQTEYKAFGGSEKMFEFFESYPELLNMTHIEGINWNTVTLDMYHTKEYMITSKKERDRILKALEKKIFSKYGDKPPVHKIKIHIYYRRKLKTGLRSPNLYRREVKYTKFTTPNIREAIASEVDKIADSLDYYYVIAERKSEQAEGMEYRTIVGRTEYK